MIPPKQVKSSPHLKFLKQKNFLLILITAALLVAAADYRSTIQTQNLPAVIPYRSPYITEDTAPPAEPWVEELFSRTETLSYARAEITVRTAVDEKKEKENENNKNETNIDYEINWHTYKTREAFLTATQAALNNTSQNTDTHTEAVSGQEQLSDSMNWTFLKFRLEPSDHALDLYHWLETNLADERLTWYTSSRKDGESLVIDQCWKDQLENSILMPRQKVILYHGCLYLLSCDNAGRDNRERSQTQLYRFEKDYFKPSYNGSFGMEEENLYWFDHKTRLTGLTDPERTFLEVRATDTNWPDKCMGRFGLLKEASYRISVPDDTDLHIRFRFAREIPENGYSAYLFNGFCSKEPYIMEVWTDSRRTLLQKEELDLCIEQTDTIRFTDMDEDGFPDMEISYPRHEFGDYLPDTRRWLWNPGLSRFELTRDEELRQRKKTNLIKNSLAEGRSALVTAAPKDTLWELSEKYYGSGVYYMEIYRRNRDSVGSNPDFLLSGTALTLPPVNERNQIMETKFMD